MSSAKKQDLSGWNYRIMSYKNGGFGIHEVFYDEKGKINGWTQDAIIVGDSVEELYDVLNMIKKDMKRMPDILNYEENTNN